MGIRSSKRKEPESRINQQDKAILELKLMRDKLKQYQKRIDTQIEKDRQIAKELLKKGNKSKALLLLKKNKFLQKNLENSDAQLDNLEKMVHSIEFKQLEIQVVNGLKLGNECLKSLNQMLTLDQVEKIMDDTQDAVEYQNRINELISGQTFSNEDETEINMELDSIIDQLLPEIPDNELPAVTQKEKTPEKSTEKKGTKQKEKTAVLAD